MSQPCAPAPVEAPRNGIRSSPAWSIVPSFSLALIAGAVGYGVMLNSVSTHLDLDAHPEARERLKDVESDIRILTQENQHLRDQMRDQILGIYKQLSEQDDRLDALERNNPQFP